MKLINFKIFNKYSFSAILLKGKSEYKIEGSFKTSHQDYPNEKDAPMYASTVVFTVVDEDGKNYLPMISDNENQELEDLLSEEIDPVLELKISEYK